MVCVFLVMHATFDVLVLGREEELSGPLQHPTIPISRSGNSPDDSRQFVRL